MDQIETLAVSNTAWITTSNNAGYSPLQIICKNGRIDEEIIDLFARIGGPDAFAVADLMGNTPLHSAIRLETKVEALLALIKAYPDALHMKTMYDDTPLHLACLRGVDERKVREVTLASSLGLETVLAHCPASLSPILVPNTAGQTPISIAMEEYSRFCRPSRSRRCCVQGDCGEAQARAFNVLVVLVEILHYGPRAAKSPNQPLNLVSACVALHRKDVRLDPAFIRRAIVQRPQDLRVADENGNYPMHVEASIPIEKMSLLNAPHEGCCCGGVCHKRIGVLRMLLEIYPEAVRLSNHAGYFPLNLMIQSGRAWDSTFSLVLQQFPQALCSSGATVGPQLLPFVLQKMSNQCGTDCVFTFLRNIPT